MGSGKSTVGRLVAERAGAEFRDLDKMVEVKLGMSIPEVFERLGEPAFRQMEADLLAEALESPGVVALGGGAPLRDDSWALIRERALSVYLEAPLAVLLDRLGAGEGRPLLGGRSEAEVTALFAARRSRYEAADRVVAADRPAGAVAEEVLRLWRS